MNKNGCSGCSAVRLAHLLWEQGVVGSNPATPTVENKIRVSGETRKRIIRQLRQAAVAQLVEHQLPKLRVTGSNPACRSTWKIRHLDENLGAFFWLVIGKFRPEYPLAGALRAVSVFLCKIFPLNGYFSKKNPYFCSPKKNRKYKIKLHV